MMNENDKRLFLCQRLHRLGFAPKHRIRLYGEEFDLVSDPVPEKNGYGIDGVSRKSGSMRHLGIPLSVVRTIEHEIYVMEQPVLAA